MRSKRRATRSDASALDRLVELYRANGSKRRGLTWNTQLRVVPDAGRGTRGRELFWALSLKEQQAFLTLCDVHHVKSSSALLVEIERWRYLYDGAFLPAASYVLSQVSKTHSEGRHVGFVTRT